MRLFIGKSLCGFALLASVPFFAHAASGTVNFTGEIIETACSVSADTASQNVVIGKYPKSLFKASGDVSTAKSFVLELKDCQPGNYTIRFDGPSPAGRNDLLKVSAAQGVGIEILDNDGKVFPLNQQINDPAIISVQKDASKATVNLKARYKSYSDVVTAGEANASAIFAIDYR